MDRRVEGETAGDRKAEAEGGAAVPDLQAVLPEDVIADVLRRLAPRDLAASRCVCKAWRGVVDARRLLRTELLPLWLGGIFINFNNYYISELFARPSTDARPSISGRRDYLPAGGMRSWSEVCDHCNGLLLVDGYDEVLRRHLEYVLNPATRWVDSLPPPPTQAPDMEMLPYRDIYVKYLAYDPTVSLHYKVFLIPRLHVRMELRHLHYDRYMDQLDPVIEQSEWPPSPCILHIFSSRTGQWDKRSFVREGEPAGAVADMRLHWPLVKRNAVCWRGRLYIHCQADFVMRISLSDHKYKVIKPPEGIDVRQHPHIYLGKSKDGVYCAMIHEWFCLRVWVLHEEGNQTEWVLKHDADLLGCLLKHNIGSRCDCQQQVCGPWILQNLNFHYASFKKIAEHKKKEIMEEKFEWSSDMSIDENSPRDNAGDDTERERYSGYLDILGFHPYKEIIFLSESITRGLAYDFSSMKILVLGDLYPTNYHEEFSNEQFITSSFSYTPCLMGQAVDETNLEGHVG